MTRLSTLDWILSLADHADFGVILRMNRTPLLEALRSGSRSARRRYPVSDSCISGRYWKPAPAELDGVREATSADPDAEAQAFLDRPLDPHREAPIQQFIAPDRFVVTRAHHAAADGFSVGMWLRRQFRVALGVDAFSAGDERQEPLRLRASHPHPRPQSAQSIRQRSAESGRQRQEPRSQALWTEKDAGPFKRRWMTLELADTFSSAALAAAALRAVASWNEMHGAPSCGMSLWLPVNIRDHRAPRFGNGTSRIRIRSAGGLEDVRRKIHRGLRHAEWSVPADPWVARLPLAIASPLARLYLDRPWADMGSVVFSHIDRWSGAGDNVFDGVDKIELIGQLHRRLPLAINAATHRGRTWMTFTYDAGRLSPADVDQFADLYRARL
ncbi:MAG TPA: hypothetical protein VFY29_05460 [Terriglobia bacterium]|nr:hypothetical protein [Terriglobia bacterium]